jgi:moderate conductance mechanosensitive channel
MRGLVDKFGVPVRALTVAVGVMLLAFAVTSEFVSEAHAQPVGVEELESLAATIEDEGKRAELLANIKALIAATREPGDEDVRQSFGPRLITKLSETAASASRHIVATTDRFTDVPILIDWIKTQATDSTSRNAWLIALLRLAVIIVVGWVAERLGRFLLSRPLRAIESRETTGIWARLPLLLARTTLDVLPVVAFAVAAYAALPLVNPGAKAQIMVVTFLQAFLLARASFILTRMLLVPAVPSLRVLPLSGVVANYLFIWSRRLISVGVYGYFLAEAAFFLGLPSDGRAGLMRLVGLLIATMLTVFILQNRMQVSQWVQNAFLRGRDARDRSARVVRWLSDVWHVLTIVYVVAAYLVWAFDFEGGFAYLFRSTVVTVVILVAAKLVSAGLRRAVERGFAVRADLKEKFPTLEARVNRYVPVIHLTLRSVLFAIVGISILQTWGIDILGALGSPAGQRVVGSAFSIGIVGVAALIF